MLFNSTDFLIFFTLICFAYFLLLFKFRNYLLLEDSGHLSNKNLFYLLFSSSNDDIITSTITNRVINRIFYHGIQPSIKSPGMSKASFAKVVSPVPLIQERRSQHVYGCRTFVERRSQKIHCQCYYRYPARKKFKS